MDLTFPARFASAAVMGLLWVGCVHDADPRRVAEYGIVGGEETADWPEVVAYIFAAGTGLCTGTVIAPNAVLTAAHCAQQAGDGDVVFIGPSVFEVGDVTDVEQVFVHPDYDPTTAYADVAVLMLVDDVDVEPVQLNADAMHDSTWRGTMLHAVGYGNADSYTGLTMGIKRETDVEVVDVGYELLYHETTGQNTCSGDSGGPLFGEVDGGWIQVAVASFVYPADTYEDYCSGGGGDVRVDTHLAWIHEQLGWEPPETDDDDDDDDDDGPAEGTSYLEDDERNGCASSLAGRGQARGGALLGVLVLILLRARCG
jgi:trypsin